MSDHISIAIFGGTSGIGQQLVPLLSQYEIISLGSKDVDLLSFHQVGLFFKENKPSVVINLAGYNYDGFLHKIELSKVLDQINVNIVGTVNLIQGALSYMRERKFGRIILSSSVLAKKTVAGTSIYSATKSFIETLSRVSASENARNNITINCLRMGYMDAGLTHRIPEGVRNQIREAIPSKMFGQIINIAEAVKFLINADYVTGTSIDINGGLNG